MNYSVGDLVKVNKNTCIKHFHGLQSFALENPQLMFFNRIARITQIDVRYTDTFRNGFLGGGYIVTASGTMPFHVPTQLTKEYEREYKFDIDNGYFTWQNCMFEKYIPLKRNYLNKIQIGDIVTNIERIYISRDLDSFIEPNECLFRVKYINEYLDPDILIEHIPDSGKDCYYLNDKELKIRQSEVQQISVVID